MGKKAEKFIVKPVIKKMSMEEIKSVIQVWQKCLSASSFSGSTKLLRKDRDG